MYAESTRVPFVPVRQSSLYDGSDWQRSSHWALHSFPPHTWERSCSLTGSGQWDRQNILTTNISTSWESVNLIVSRQLALRIFSICTISWNIKKLISFTHNNSSAATPSPVFTLITHIFIASNSQEDYILYYYQQ